MVRVRVRVGVRVGVRVRVRVRATAVGRDVLPLRRDGGGEQAWLGLGLRLG